VIGERLGQVPFRAHVELLQLFLAHRDQIVEKIAGMLNAQRRPIEDLQDRPTLSRHCEDCFFSLTAITPDQSRLRGQLEHAHWASGFKPRETPGMHNDLVDPGEMMIRSFHLWRQTRWPGRHGRARYAHTLFSLYLIRSLALLSMRVWDAGAAGACERLSQVQSVLDQLWSGAPADQPVFVRDARWLIPLAQSPTTDELAAYFAVAEQIAATPSQVDRIEIQKAAVQLAGGHLRSQLRHYCIKKGVSLDEESLVLSARNSNALDFALLIQGLVPLLEAYEHACDLGDRRNRVQLARAICQGISADPELFVNRVDLLAAYSMIEDLFITTDRDGQVVYTPVGQRHIELLHEYESHIGRLSRPLYEDCPQFRPVEGAYSPYGVIYGFSSNLTEHMGLKTLQPEAVTEFSLEDAFAEGDASTKKRAWVSGWRRLPHIEPEVQRLFDYPQQFAEDIFERIEQALRRGAFGAKRNAVGESGRLFIVPAEGLEPDSEASQIPDLPLRYIGSSDAQLIAAEKAHWYDEARLLRDRHEGMFLVSYRTPGGWTAISKDVLTKVLGAGRDAKVAQLPDLAVGVLRLMCPDLAFLPDTLAH